MAPRALDHLARAAALLALALIAMAVAVGSAAAKSQKTGKPPVAMHDTLIVISDTTAVDTSRLSTDKLARFDQPKWVMFRSMALPGWGQLHNGSWPKAMLIGGVEGYMIVRLGKDRRDLAEINDQIETARAAGNADAEAALVQTYNDRSDRYVGHQWWLGAVVAYSMLDAYIDAHFRNFSIDINDDPSLPPEDRRAAGLKISWQEHF